MAKLGILFFFSLFVSIKMKIACVSLFKLTETPRRVPKKKSTSLLSKLAKVKKRVLEVLKILSVSLVNTAVRDYGKHLDQWFLTWVRSNPWGLVGRSQGFGRASEKKYIYVLNLKKILFYFSLQNKIKNH